MRKISVKQLSKKAIAIILLVVVAILSMTLFTKTSTDQKKYDSIIASIDDKKETVTKITLAADAASIAIAAIPGDATTPIADKIIDISSYLIVVIGALVLEKILLTTFGLVAFKYIIPISCALLIIYLLSQRTSFKIIALKLVVFALVVVNIVPVSMKISDYIYEMNEDTVNMVSDSNEFEEIAPEEETQQEEPDSIKSWLSQKLSSVKETVSSGTQEAMDSAKEISNKFLDAVAVMLLTSCIIPILVVFIVFWLIKFLFENVVPIESNINIVRPMRDRRKNMARRITGGSEHENSCE